MRFNFVATEQINLSIFSAVVGRTFLYQVKLYEYAYLGSYFECSGHVFLWQPLMGLQAQKDENFTIWALWSGNFLHPDFPFMQCVFIMVVVPIFIGLIVYFRWGFGMLALLQGSEKVGLMASWRKSRHNFAGSKVSYSTLRCYGLIDVGWQSVSFFEILLNLIVQAVAAVVFVPML